MKVQNSNTYWKTFITYLLFGILFTPLHSFSQVIYELDKTTRFEKIGPDEGLSSVFTSCIHQDKYGFIWVGTKFGLNMFDGYEIETFNPNSADTNSLFNGKVYCIYEEEDGTMWFGTHQGMSKFNRANQTFSNYLPVPTHPDSVANIVQKIIPNGDYLWVDVSWGLFRFHKKTGQFKSFAKNSLNPEKGLYAVGSDYIASDKSGVLWVYSSNNEDISSLNKFNSESETITHFLNNSADPQSFPTPVKQ